MPIKKDSKKISRSTKLRKYATVYKSYVRKSEQSKINKSPRRSRKVQNPTITRNSDINQYEEKKCTKKLKEKLKEKVKSKKKSLNSYQKFVKEQSKKDKYKELPGKQRLSAIALEWKKIHN